MQAELVLHERHDLTISAFAELKIWRVPRSVRGSEHSYKYSLAFIVEGVCRLRYDNEAGKGDHRHLDEAEEEYQFVSIARLLEDFWSEVDEWLVKPKS